MQITNSLQKSRALRRPDHHYMDLIFSVEKTDIARAACCVTDWDGGDTHLFNGKLQMDQQVIGDVTGVLAGFRFTKRDRGGAPPKFKRDVAAWLASKWFSIHPRAKLGMEVLTLWQEKGYKGFSENGHALNAIKRGAEHAGAHGLLMRVENVKGINQMIYWTQGAHIELVAGTPGTLVSNGPGWLWNFGDEEATEYESLVCEAKIHGKESKVFRIGDPTMQLI